MAKSTSSQRAAANFVDLQAQRNLLISDHKQINEEITALERELAFCNNSIVVYKSTPTGIEHYVTIDDIQHIKMDFPFVYVSKIFAELQSDSSLLAFYFIKNYYILNANSEEVLCPITGNDLLRILNSKYNHRHETKYRRQEIQNNINKAKNIRAELERQINNLTRSDYACADLRKRLDSFINQANDASKYIPDMKVVRMVQRWEIRCKTLDLVKRNDVECLGLTQREMADQLNVSTYMVNLISQLYNFNNRIKYVDLWEKKRGPKVGIGNKISMELLLKIVDIIENVGPIEKEINSFAWSASAIVELLKKEGVDVNEKYIYYLFRKLHITSKFMTRKNPKQCDSLVAHYKSSIIRDVLKNAKKDGYTILFYDECHIQISHRMKGYAMANSRSIGSYDPRVGHSNYSICTFIGLDGFIRVFIIEGTFNSDKFIECLEQLKKENPNKKFHIIMDNSPVHQSMQSMAWLLTHKNFYTFSFLPPYAPKLNVVEFFNNTFKQELKEDVVLDNISMIKKAYDICDKYNSNTGEIKDKIKSLYNNKECTYIMNTIYRLHILSDLNKEKEPSQTTRKA